MTSLPEHDLILGEVRFAQKNLPDYLAILPFEALSGNDCEMGMTSLTNYSRARDDGPGRGRRSPHLQDRLAGAILERQRHDWPAEQGVGTTDLSLHPHPGHGMHARLGSDTIRVDQVDTKACIPRLACGHADTPTTRRNATYRLYPRADPDLWCLDAQMDVHPRGFSH